MNRYLVRLVLATIIGSIAWSSAQIGPSAAVTAGPSVCVSGGGCYATLQPALDAAPAGATVTLGPGRYDGGVVIDKSLTLTGAGPDQTVVSGGGPVISVVATQKQRPTVEISGLEVTGGVTTHDIKHGDTDNAPGGGIFVAPTYRGVGATVRLDDVVVTGNATAPESTSPSPSGVQCPHRDCPYAGSFGGGIASWGNLTLTGSVVSDNLAGGIASDADGGGIYSAAGSLRISSSLIQGNRAEPDQIGRFAEGGGVFVASGHLVDIEHTVIDGNLAALTTSWPVKARGKVIDMNANSGGVHIGDGLRATLVDVSLTHNTVSATDLKGEPLAFDGAMLVGDSPTTLRNSLVAGNTVEARVKTSADQGFSGTTLEFDGAPAVVSRIRVVDNVASEQTRYGVAQANNGVAVFNFTDHDPGRVVLTHSVVSGNTATAASRHGKAIVQGAGVMNNSLLRMEHDRVTDNRASATGSDAVAQGAGIWNGPLLSGPPVHLVLRHVDVTGNAVSAPGGTRQGGGIYTTVAIDVLGLHLARNRPDQCHGCTLR